MHTRKNAVTQTGERGGLFAIESGTLWAVEHAFGRVAHVVGEPTT